MDLKVFQINSLITLSFAINFLLMNILWPRDFKIDDDFRQMMHSLNIFIFDPMTSLTLFYFLRDRY